MILPPAATAASGADPSNPSLNQYVESVPSSHGDGTPPSGGAGSGSGQLPASVRHRIEAQGGPDAKQLEAVAGSPALGAPASKPGGSSHTQGGSSPVPAAADHRPSGLRAAADATVGGDGSSVVLLALGLLVVTTAAGGMALARRRSTAI